MTTTCQFVEDDCTYIRDVSHNVIVCLCNPRMYVVRLSVQLKLDATSLKGSQLKRCYDTKPRLSLGCSTMYRHAQQDWLPPCMANWSTTFRFLNIPVVIPITGILHKVYMQPRSAKGIILKVLLFIKGIANYINCHKVKYSNCLCNRKG